MGDEVLEPGQEIRPKISQKGAIYLVEHLYGVKVESVREMNSYDDKNFLFTFSETNGHTDIEVGKKYNMKVLNSMDSQKTHVGRFTFIKHEHEIYLTTIII